MVSEKLKDWIKEKREEGISDERIRKSLEKTGHDPSVLDEVDDPFASSDSTDSSDDLFNSSEPGNSENNDRDQELQSKETESSQSFPDDSRKGRMQKISENLNEAGSNYSYEPDNDNQENNEEKESLKEKLPSVNLPSKPGLDVSGSLPNTPSAPRPSRNQVLAFSALIVLLVGGVGAYSFMPDNFNHRLVLGDEISSSHLGTLDRLDSKYNGCPDAGISIRSISSTDSSTTVEAVTTDQMWVVLEVKEQSNVIGYTTKQVESSSELKVGKKGDEAVLRPLGCESKYSLRSY